MLPEASRRPRRPRLQCPSRLPGGCRQESERLRAAIDQAEEAGQPAVALFAAELGARYFQTLHEWAVWALDRLDQHPSPG